MDIRSGSDGYSNNDGGNNKRKRKNTDDKNSENHRPAKRSHIRKDPADLQQQTPHHTTNAATTMATTTDTASNENDLVGSVGSPQSLSHILSPIADVSPKKNSVRGESTPHGQKKHHITDEDTFSTNMLCCVTPSSELRLCPLPPLSWAEAGDVWKLMCRKDEKASLDRDSRMLYNHPGILPRMRAILLDWLIEVCEVYKLHRETYYLAVDYLDRFLSTNIKISKTRLQLIGITCLFVAAKVEEIYPPKIGEFAYVTDGACREEDIIQQELIMLTALKWSISPVTIIGWLSVYMQLNSSNRTPKSLNSVNNKSTKYQAENNLATDAVYDGDSFVYPQFSGLEFVQAAQLIDLCTLDLGLANFPYSVIAAAALCHTYSKSIALKVSGIEWNIVAPCVKWMEPFYEVICEESPQIFLLEQNEQVKASYGLNHICPNIITDDSHIIQTHSTSLNLFDRAILKKEKLEAAVTVITQEASPAQTVEHSCPDGLLTPPASNRKFLGSDNLEAEPDITKTIY